MLSCRRPDDATIARFLENQAPLEFSYDAVGATQTQAVPAGFVYDHYRTRLGEGDAAFEVACDALKRWAMFDVGWMTILDPSSATPASAPSNPVEGMTIGLLINLPLAWWLNACRVIYVIDESQPRRRFGFAYGTLPDHAERGEERFLVEQDDAGVCWYDLSAISRPSHWLTKLGYPVARAMQKRFARQSQAAMQQAVERSTR